MINFIKKKYKKYKEIRKKLLYKSFGETLYSEFRSAKILLIYLDEVGIKNIEYTPHDMIITYNDNTKAILWNSRWNCWMSYGDIEFSNGEKMSWKEKQPSLEVLYKYKQVVLNYEENEALDKYLPIKLQRKRKLNKLNEK